MLFPVDPGKASAWGGGHGAALVSSSRRTASAFNLQGAILRGRFRFGALLCVAWMFVAGVLPAVAEEDLAPETKGLDSRAGFRTGTRFFDEAELSGGVYFFRRDRRRYDVDKRRYETNLNHASMQANVDFVSGFAGGWLGFDFGVFGSHDLLNKGAVDHEMGFEPGG